MRGCMQGVGDEETGCAPGVGMGLGLGRVGRGETTRHSSEADSHGGFLIHGRGKGSHRHSQRYVVCTSSSEELHSRDRCIGESGWARFGRGKIPNADLHRVSGCK